MKRGKASPLKASRANKRFFHGNLSTIILIILNAVLISAHLLNYLPVLSDSSPRASIQKSRSTGNVLRPLNANVPGIKTRTELHEFQVRDSDPKKISGFVAGLSLDQLSEFSVPISEWLLEDEAAATAWVNHLANEMLADENFSQIFFLLQYLNRHDEIRNTERKVVHRWTENGPEQILDYYKQMARDEGVIDPHMISIAASVMQNERVADRSEFFSLVSKLENPDLQGMFAEKFLVHATNDSINEVVSFIEGHIDNPKVALSAIGVAAISSIEKPEQTLDWIANLEIADRAVHAEAFATVFKEISIHRPDLAVDIISGEKFLEKYYHSESRDESGNFTQGAKEFFDIALASFVESSMHFHPDIAAEATSAFFDTALGNSLKKQAESLIDLPPLEVNHKCSHCNQTH